MKNPYAAVTNYATDENYEAHNETVVCRGHRYTRTVYLPKGESNGVAIPPRQPNTSTGLTLDLSKIAEETAWADQIRATLSQ